MKTRVKICGITRARDAIDAAALGVHAVGLVFVDRSPRAVSVEQAVEIRRALPPLVGVVGLFMDAAAERVESVSRAVGLNWLQFHGGESPAYCRAFGRPYIKALPMASPAMVDYSPWSDAAALLLDAHAPGAMGGSGESFDWAAIKAPEQSWMLAGGLDPDNVGRAIRMLNPPAVDVSSGVESAPGIKDYNLMQRFMKGIRHD